MLKRPQNLLSLKPHKKLEKEKEKRIEFQKGSLYKFFDSNKKKKKIYIYIYIKQKLGSKITQMSK